MMVHKRRYGGFHSVRFVGKLAKFDIVLPLEARYQGPNLIHFLALQIKQLYNFKPPYVSPGGDPLPCPMNKARLLECSELLTVLNGLVYNSAQVDIFEFSIQKLLSHACAKKGQTKMAQLVVYVLGAGTELPRSKDKTCFRNSEVVRLGGNI
jgi:hypothetical protein